jgi:hypothetical protein
MESKSKARARINPAGKSKREAFLTAFAKVGNIRMAAQMAKCARASHYLWMKDPEYAKRYEEAADEACDLLEAEARRRAEHGIEEPVVHKGRLCFRPVLDEQGRVVLDDDGQPKMVPFTIRRYSDTLLIFLLKALKPEKYRDHYRAPHTSQVNIAAELIAAQERLAKARLEDTAQSQPPKPDLDTPK